MMYLFNDNNGTIDTYKYADTDDIRYLEELDLEEGNKETVQEYIDNKYIILNSYIKLGENYDTIKEIYENINDINCKWEFVSLLFELYKVIQVK